MRKLVLLGVVAAVVGAAGVASAQSGDAASIVALARRAFEADKVDGLSAASKPLPGTLLALDRRAKLPASVLPGGTLVWRGAWQDGTHYATGDAVSFAGSAYVALRANSGDQPPAPSWQLLASGGSAGPPGPAGPQGPAGGGGAQGPQGPSGANGRTVLNGAGVPDPSLGTVGDFYIDTSSHALYGAKSAAGWGSGVSLVGPAGTNGTNATDGATGPPGPTSSAFHVKAISAVSSSTTVVSFSISPSFAGNLLLQASGWVSFGPTGTSSGASCQHSLDGLTIGNGTQAWLTGAAPQEALAVTGAASVSAGTHTVTIQCAPVVTGTTPTVFLDAFAIVAAS